MRCVRKISSPWRAVQSLLSRHSFPENLGLACCCVKDLLVPLFFSRLCLRMRVLMHAKHSGSYPQKSLLEYLRVLHLRPDNSLCRIFYLKVTAPYGISPYLQVVDKPPRPRARVVAGREREQDAACSNSQHYGFSWEPFLPYS